MLVYLYVMQVVNKALQRYSLIKLLLFKNVYEKNLVKIKVIITSQYIYIVILIDHHSKSF